MNGFFRPPTRTTTFRRRKSGPDPMKAVVIQPVNSLRTVYVDLKELIRIYIKRALVVENQLFI